MPSVRAVAGVTLIDRLPEAMDECTDAIDGLGRFLDHPHDGAADDNAVGHGGDLARLLRAANPKSHADWGRRLPLDPDDQIPHPRRQLIADAGHPGERDAINEPCG